MKCERHSSESWSLALASLQSATCLPDAISSRDGTIVKRERADLCLPSSSRVSMIFGHRLKRVRDVQEVSIILPAEDAEVPPAIAMPVFRIDQVEAIKTLLPSLNVTLLLPLQEEDTLSPPPPSPSCVVDQRPSWEVRQIDPDQTEKEIPVFSRQNLLGGAAQQRCPLQDLSDITFEEYLRQKALSRKQRYASRRT
ncbi:MAG: uncharacterized protein KVP18_000388 [Porospora cf. gigantea A]|uniref:uncharacterized protein n=1 Tax=Porospora cf. gigantea A TaxID=2853593 RepID=UPI00355A3AE7|nr:MAG: hypothetical protein KVP18_000388 [Porospora cf. gigantea A]